MTPVQITVTAQEWDRLAHDVHRGVRLIALLRKAGVPVEGSIWPTVASGCLVHYRVGTDLVWSFTS